MKTDFRAIVFIVAVLGLSILVSYNIPEYLEHKVEMMGGTR